MYPWRMECPTIPLGADARSILSVWTWFEPCEWKENVFMFIVYHGHKVKEEQHNEWYIRRYFFPYQNSCLLSEPWEQWQYHVRRPLAFLSLVAIYGLVCFIPTDTLLRSFRVIYITESSVTMRKKGETGGFSIVETYVDTIATQIYYKPDKFFKCLNSTKQVMVWIWLDIHP